VRTTDKTVAEIAGYRPPLPKFTATKSVQDFKNNQPKTPQPDFKPTILPLSQAQIDAFNARHIPEFESEPTQKPKKKSINSAAFIAAMALAATYGASCTGAIIADKCIKQDACEMFEAK